MHLSSFSPPLLLSQPVQGGMRRVRYTLVPLMFRYLSLARSVYAAGQNAEEGDEESMAPARVAAALRKIFQLVHEIVNALAGIEELQELTHKL